MATDKNSEDENGSGVQMSRKNNLKEGMVKTKQQQQQRKYEKKLLQEFSNNASQWKEPKEILRGSQSESKKRK